MGLVTGTGPAKVTDVELRWSAWGTRRNCQDAIRRRADFKTMREVAPALNTKVHVRVSIRYRVEDDREAASSWKGLEIRDAVPTDRTGLNPVAVVFPFEFHNNQGIKFCNCAQLTEYSSSLDRLVLLLGKYTTAARPSFLFST